jgi:hypothetical protein
MLVVITDQPDLEALADAVLRPRAGKALRAGAIEAIRAANPTVDLRDLRPGMIVRIPRVEGARERPDGEGAEPAEGLVAHAESGLAALEAATEHAITVAEQERDAAQRVLASAELRRLAAARPELGSAIDAWRETAKKDAASFKEESASLRSGAERWREELADLRALLED